MNGVQDMVTGEAGQDVSFPRTEAADFDGQEIILDADADSSFTADTDDIVDLKLRGQDLFKFDGATGGTTVNGLTFLASATGAAVQIKGQGSDAAIDILLDPKGTGVVDLDGATLTIDADADTTLRATADDVVALRLQGVDSFIFDGDVASPTNGLTFTTTATGGHPSITAQGSDTNINVEVIGKGTGGLRVTAGTQGILLDADPAGTGVDIDGAPLVIDADADSSLRATADDVVALRLQAVDAFIFDGDVATPVNGFTFKSSATTVAPSIEAQGSDANISINLVPKGTGTVQVGGQPLSGTLIASYTPSAVASLDITSAITSSFRFYDIYYHFVPVSNDVELWIRTDTANGASFDSGASDYSWENLGFQGSGGGGSNAVDNADSEITLCNNTAGNSVANDTGISGVIQITHLGNPGKPTLLYTTTYVDTAGDHWYITGSGVHLTAAAINAVQFLFETGNIASGAVGIYGRR